MGEVDQFLDEVEAELERLLKENEDLRSKLAAHGDGAAPVPVATARPEKAPEKVEPTSPSRAEAGRGRDTGARPPRRSRSITAAEASSAATRLLELATRNADELVAEAREEAEKIVGEARTEAEQLSTETKERTDKLEQDARTRAQNLDSETDEPPSRAVRRAREGARAASTARSRTCAPSSASTAAA